MRHISQIKAFEDDFELFELPAVRIIGRQVKSGGALGNTAPALWGEVFGSEDCGTLLSLPHIVPDGLYGWTCEPDGDTFIYIVCAMTPADTAVPEGFIFRDIPATVCAKGLFGEDIPSTIERAKSLGYVTNWEPYGWNAELYIHAEEENPPKQGCNPWHWLVPVRKAVI
ncbi:MAG: GyrI-like domain-containing protein [Eubacteriales bacterium]